MRLFEYRDYRLNVLPEVYTIKVFKQLSARDRTENKTKLEKELAYIYFMYDPRSDLQYLIDEDERAERAKELIGLDFNFKPDKLLDEAIRIYKENTKTTSSLLIEDIKIGANKLREFIKTATVDDNTFDKYTRALSALIPLAERLSDAEKKVIREVEELSDMRGNKQKTLLDGGFDNLFK